MFFKDVPESGAAALGIGNVGGVFVVLIGGLSLACIIAFCENLWNKRNVRRAALLVSFHLCFSYILANCDSLKGSSQYLPLKTYNYYDYLQVWL